MAGKMKTGMTEDLTAKAAEMLLNGATLLGQPCPYCKGVRVMKKGQALCISCGRHPEKGDTVQAEQDKPIQLEKTLEKKLETLSKELESEKDHDKQQAILKTINSLLATIEKIREK